MLRVCDGCKDVPDTDQDGTSVSMKWGFAHPFRANRVLLSILSLDVKCIPPPPPPPPPLPKKDSP